MPNAAYPYSVREPRNPVGRALLENPNKPLVWLHGENVTPPSRGKTHHEQSSARTIPTRRVEGGTVGEFFDLTPAEEALIETKLRLGGVVRALRERSHLSQAALAKRIGSSQPRVAKIENHDPEVSLELQMKAIFASRPSASRELAALIKRWEAPVYRRNTKAPRPRALIADRLKHRIPSSRVA